MNLDFYKGKKVLITGHTGFKGSWLCKMLLEAGAEVSGYALKPPSVPSLFELCHLQSQLHSVEGDIRDLGKLQKIFQECRPEYVFHLAAQPIVRESYKDPVYTYAVNVMGTVNVLECIRHTDTVKSVVNVTTDKVYCNKEWEWGYRENEELNGFDPYSNSKSCSELVTASFKNSFFYSTGVTVSTARAGNVIGGGDFAVDRIIPDCIRAAQKRKNIIVRNPYSVRPYQHVLEPLYAYLLLAAKQEQRPELAGSYNIGPDEGNCVTTGNVVDLFCKKWEAQTGDKLIWEEQYDGGPHEANFLKLDCAKAKKYLGYNPVWNIDTAIEKVVEFSIDPEPERCMERQIYEYLMQIG